MPNSEKSKTRDVPLVTVRCVHCKAIRELRADSSEFGPADVPMCECGCPMATVGIKSVLR